MPGSTAHPFSSPAFRGRSRNGAYGDAVEELDWSAGEILAALRRLGLDRRTLVIWTSDNGAVRRNPPQGSCAPYQGWGYDTSEGAMRMPCVMRWPGRIPAGRITDEVCSTIDLLPTFAGLAGAALPPREIDGHDIGPTLLGTPGAKSPWDEKGFCYYFGAQLQAVRAGPWKLYLPLEQKIINLTGKRALAAAALYDVRHDVGEESEVSAQQPEVVQRLKSLAEKTRRVIGDENLPGIGQRPAGHEPNPVPLKSAAKRG
jgi:arylsulfatase A-like enzyme